MFHQVTYKLLQFLEFLLAICLVLQAHHIICHLDLEATVAVVVLHHTSCLHRGVEVYTFSCLLEVIE